jgi:hypothetical protein
MNSVRFAHSVKAGEYWLALALCVIKVQIQKNLLLKSYRIPEMLQSSSVNRQ